MVVSAVTVSSMHLPCAPASRVQLTHEVFATSDAMLANAMERVLHRQG